MLLPLVMIILIIMNMADVIAIVCGRCYAPRADVVAQLGSICSMAGVIAINCGRCCCHLF